MGQFLDLVCLTGVISPVEDSRKPQLCTALRKRNLAGCLPCDFTTWGHSVTFLPLMNEKPSVFNLMGQYFGRLLIAWLIHSLELALCQGMHSWSADFWHTCFQLFIQVAEPFEMSLCLLTEYMHHVCSAAQKWRLTGLLLAAWQAVFLLAHQNLQQKKDWVC